MDIANMLMNIIFYGIPFVILYYVVAAAVKKGIDTSEAGRVILEKYEANLKKKK